MDGQGTKRRRKMAEYFNRLSRAHQRDRRATAYIANVNMSSRSLKRHALVDSDVLNVPVLRTCTK